MSNKSTGPITEEGKKRSSQNALTHGLTAESPVLPTEDPKAYQRHIQSFLDEYHPIGATETQLVQSLADTTWRLNRIAALETSALALDFDRQLKALATLSLYSHRLSRQFEKALSQLRALQNDRPSQLRDLVNIVEMYEDNGEPYNPADHGFVFSKVEIDTAMRLRDRDRDALEAYQHSLAA